MRRALASAAALVVAALLVTSCSSDEARPSTTPGGTGGGDAARTAAPDAPVGGTLRLGIERVESFDPADASPTREHDLIVADLLFDGLTSIDPATGAAVPALARSITPDQYALTWTVELREDARFSDGSPVTAQDVRFSLERLAQKGTASLAGSQLELIAGYPELVAGAPSLAGIAVTGDRSLQITLKEPYAPLPELLSSPVYGVVPQGTVSAEGSPFAAKPVGSGPFVLRSVEGDTIRLDRSAGSKASLDHIELVRFDDRAGPLQALRERRVDFATVPPATSVDIPADVGVVRPGKESAELFFGFNLANPEVGEGRDLLRKAVVKAVDRRRIAEQILHSRQPLDGIVPPSLAAPAKDGRPAAPCGDTCSYDVEGARALVAQGFPDGNVPTVLIEAYDGESVEDRAQADAARAIEADLRAAGIPVQLTFKPYEEYRSSLFRPEQQVFSYGWIGLAPDPDLYLGLLFSSASEHNITHFATGGIDFALVKARATLDREERMAIYADIEREVMANVPVIPLAVFDSTVVLGPKVQGYVPRPDGTFVVEQLSVTPG